MSTDIFGATLPSVTVQQITFTAKVPGIFPKITFVNGGTAGAEVVSVDSSHNISVQLASGTSTTTQVVAAIVATGSGKGTYTANELVACTIAGGQGAAVCTSFVGVALSGGVNTATAAVLTGGGSPARTVVSGDRFAISLNGLPSKLVVFGDNQTAGNSVSNTSPATTTTAGNQLTINVNADGARTITLASSGNGAAVAADIQAKVRALRANSEANQAAINGFTCVFTTVYTLTSGTTGVGSSVAVTNSGIASNLKLGAANGGTETAGAIPTGAALAADIQAKVRAMSDATAFSSFTCAFSGGVFVLTVGAASASSSISCVDCDRKIATLLKITDALAGSNVAGVAAPVATKARLDLVGGISFVAKGAAAEGNDVTIVFTTGATAGSEVVSVSTHAIGIQIEQNVSTVAQVIAAVAASGAANALVGVFANGTSVSKKVNSGWCPSATNLTGGVDAAAATTGAVQLITVVANSGGTTANGKTISLIPGGTAGSESVTVTSGNVVVAIESGVSTVTQVVDAMNNAAAFSTLYTASGTSTNTPLTVYQSTMTGAGSWVPAPIRVGLDSSNSYYEDQAGTALTTSFVEQAFGFSCIGFILENKDAAKVVSWSWDGVNVAGSLAAAEAVALDNVEHKSIYLKSVAAGAEYKLMAW